MISGHQMKLLRKLIIQKNLACDTQDKNKEIKFFENKETKKKDTRDFSPFFYFRKGKIIQTPK